MIRTWVCGMPRFKKDLVALEQRERRAASVLGHRADTCARAGARDDGSGQYGEGEGYHTLRNKCFLA